MTSLRSSTRMMAFPFLVLITLVLLGIPSQCITDFAAEEEHNLAPPSGDGIDHPLYQTSNIISDSTKTNPDPNPDASATTSPEEQPTELAHYGVLAPPGGSEADDSYDQPSDQEEPYAVEYGDGVEPDSRGIFMSMDNPDDEIKSNIRKRHLGSLARQGDQLARKIQQSYDIDKRHLGSLARQGDQLARKIQQSYDMDKRNLGALARQGDQAARKIQHPYSNDKRNLGALARQGDQAARKIQHPHDTDKRNLGALARQGDQAARKIQHPYSNDKRNLESLARQGDQLARKIQQSYDMDKRNLGALARQGDPVARKIQQSYKRLPSTSSYAYYEHDGSDFDVADPQDLEYTVELLEKAADSKRHIGALARDDELHKLRYSTNRTPSPLKPTPWRRKPKRANGDDSNSDEEATYDDDVTANEDDVINNEDDVISNEDDVANQQESQYENENNNIGESAKEEDDSQAADEPFSLVKKHIQSLARMGTLTNLRTHRRPSPFGEGVMGDMDGYDYTVRTSDGYKRNIASLARIATPGSGFRTWLRDTPEQTKRKLLMRSAGAVRYMDGRRRQANRGVRSTRIMEIPLRSPPPLLSRRPGSGSAIRSPMAFMARRMFKRGAVDAIVASQVVPPSEIIGPQLESASLDHERDAGNRSVVGQVSPTVKARQYAPKSISSSSDPLSTRETSVIVAGGSMASI